MASLAMSTRLPLAVAPVRRPFGAFHAAGSSKQPRARPVLRRADGPLREFKEDTGEVSTSSGSSGGGEEVSQAQQALYADEKPQPPRDTMSPEMKERLRREYYGLGGSPNKPMSGNYFLNIILVISLLAVLSKVFGYI